MCGWKKTAWARLRPKHIDTHKDPNFIYCSQSRIVSMSVPWVTTSVQCVCFNLRTWWIQMCHRQSLHLHQVLGNGLPMMEWMTMSKIPCWGNPWPIGHPPTTCFARSRFCFSCCKMDAHSCHRGFGQHFCMCVLYVLYSCFEILLGWKLKKYICSSYHIFTYDNYINDHHIYQITTISNYINDHHTYNISNIINSHPILSISMTKVFSDPPRSWSTKARWWPAWKFPRRRWCPANRPVAWRKKIGSDNGIGGENMGKWWLNMVENIGKIWGNMGNNDMIKKNQNLNENLVG